MDVGPYFESDPDDSYDDFSLNWICFIAFVNTIADQPDKGAEIEDETKKNILEPAWTHKHLNEEVENHCDVNLLLPHHGVYLMHHICRVDDDENN